MRTGRRRDRVRHQEQRNARLRPRDPGPDAPGEGRQGRVGPAGGARLRPAPGPAAVPVGDYVFSNSEIERIFRTSNFKKSYFSSFSKTIF